MSPEVSTSKNYIYLMIKFIEEVLFKGSGGSVGDHSPEWTIVVRKE